MRGQVTKLPLDELVEDIRLYPRLGVDTTHVSTLCEALRAGATLPPIIVDKRSMSVVDGYHRVRAWRRVNGKDSLIPAEVVDYPDNMAMLIDATRRNAAHGRVLDAQDKVHVVRMMRDAGVAYTTIAEVLQITETAAESYNARVAEVVQRPTYNSTLETKQYVPLKASVSHFAGRTMTPEQVEAHKSAPGTSYMLLVRQLQQGLEHGLLDTANTSLLDALSGLREAIDAYMAKMGAVA